LRHDWCGWLIRGKFVRSGRGKIIGSARKIGLRLELYEYRAGRADDRRLIRPDCRLSSVLPCSRVRHRPAGQGFARATVAAWICVALLFEPSVSFSVRNTKQLQKPLLFR
jgi:hypothetical protein